MVWNDDEMMGVAASLSQAHLTEASADFKHYAKKLERYQKFSKTNLLVKTVPQASKRGIKHFFTSNIERFEKKIWSLPFQPLLDFPA
jgi:hypothetical protein